MLHDVMSRTTTTTTMTVTMMADFAGLERKKISLVKEGRSRQALYFLGCHLAGVDRLYDSGYAVYQCLFLESQTIVGHGPFLFSGFDFRSALWCLDTSVYAHGGKQASTQASNRRQGRMASSMDSLCRSIATALKTIPAYLT